MIQKIFSLILITTFFLTQNSWAMDEPLACPPGMMTVVAANSVFTPPTRIEAPPKLSRELWVKPFGCRRSYSIKRTLQPIDSYHQLDAEQLRPHVQDIPQAVSSLNRYQNNIKGAKAAAYVGTVGLLMLIGSLFIPAETSRTLKTIALAGGAGLMTGGFIITFGVLRTNESNLEDAVKFHNQARPQEPIKLQFSTGILF